MEPKLSFEEALPSIIAQIEQKRKKWNVHVSYLDFDDIKQLLLIHIFKKWSMYDPKRGELSHWISRICSSQIKNHWRNLLGNTMPPCDYCPAYEGNGKCRIFALVDSEKCALLRKWEKTKQQKYNLKLAANIDDFPNVLDERDCNSSNYVEIFNRITELIRPKLTKRQYAIYVMLYIDHMTEEDIGIKLGYKSNEGRIAGYASIHNYRRAIVKKIKDIIREHDLI